MAQSEIQQLWYNSEVENIRKVEFPILQETIYLDHAGTAIPAKSLMDHFAKDMVKTLCANPHSTSIASQETSKRIEVVRHRLLQYFNADPELYDLVFVANATAGIKLVAESLREVENGFWFGYHNAAHTSIVGIRELAASHQHFACNEQVENWLVNSELDGRTEYGTRIFAYPAQSNMNGARFPLQWCDTIRTLFRGKVLTLLDAASLVSTTSLDLSRANADFTVVSLYKIFGFPDLGALILRKSTRSIFQKRKYFGGGTVDAVTCDLDRWHVKRSRSLHEQLEDGSLPIHSISAVETAIDAHKAIFGDLDRISRHCAFLAQRLYTGLSALRHNNNAKVCILYHDLACDHRDLIQQGPIVTFNILDAAGYYLSTAEVEKLASIKRIQLRTGGLCNPGGVTTALGLSSHDVKENYANGQRCGSDNDLVQGRPTSMIRLSIGPANTISDVDSFIEFVTEFFVSTTEKLLDPEPLGANINDEAPFVVESLIIYPIKSCAGWLVPHDMPWTINKEGLAWDREWCIVSAGTGAVMNQKRHPRMALLHPVLDLKEGLLRIHCADESKDLAPIIIPLSINKRMTNSIRDIRICEDEMTARVYTAPYLIEFLQRALEVSCFLARFAPQSTSSSARHSKMSNKSLRASNTKPLPKAFLHQISSQTSDIPLLLSNESPILIISRSSLNQLNEQIKANGGKAVHAAAFRANIVLAETFSSYEMRREQPYVEDTWQMLKIGNQTFHMLGPCRRCQMVCVDQMTGVRHQEPFVTLAKTRRYDGLIFFGQHSCHVPTLGQSTPKIMVGNAAVPVT